MLLLVQRRWLMGLITFLIGSIGIGTIKHGITRVEHVMNSISVFTAFNISFQSSCPSDISALLHLLRDVICATLAIPCTCTRDGGVSSPPHTTPLTPPLETLAEPLAEPVSPSRLRLIRISTHMDRPALPPENGDSGRLASGEAPASDDIGRKTGPCGPNRQREPQRTITTRCENFA
jgi:hypothetical protein